MNIAKIAAATLGAVVLTGGVANAQYVSVGNNVYGPSTGVSVGVPPTIIANNYGYGYNNAAAGVAYVAPVGGSYIVGANAGYGTNSAVYNASNGSAPYAGYSDGYNNTAPTAYTSVPVGTVPYSQVVGQLYDPVTEACFVRTDVYNYYTYDVYTASGTGLSSFVGRYTDGPYYQTSYESSYAGACR